MKEPVLTKAQRTNNPLLGISKRLYSINEASIYLGRSVWAVREMLWAGKLPFIKDGRRILLDILDLEKWIDQHKIKSTY